MDAPSPGDVIVQHHHLSPANPRAGVAHAVVVPDARVLVMRCVVPRLGGVKLRLLRFVFGEANQRPAPRRRDHLVPVKGEAGKLAKGAAPLSLVLASRCLGGVLQHREALLVGNRRDLVHLCRHAIQVRGDNGFWLLSPLGDAVV